MQCPKCGEVIPDFWKRHDQCGWTKIEGKPVEEAKARLILNNKEIFQLALEKSLEYVIQNKLNPLHGDTPKVMNAAFNLFWEFGLNKQQDLIGK